jgi:hypothetical protein
LTEEDLAQSIAFHEHRLREEQQQQLQKGQGFGDIFRWERF